MSFIKLTQSIDDGEEIGQILIDVDNIRDCKRDKGWPYTEVRMKDNERALFYVKETIDEIHKKIRTMDVIYCQERGSHEGL